MLCTTTVSPSRRKASIVSSCGRWVSLSREGVFAMQPAKDQFGNHAWLRGFLREALEEKET